MVVNCSGVRLISFCLLFSCFGWGCGGPQKAEIKPGPAIRGLNLTGTWDSSPFGRMTLKQDGVSVTGGYTDPRGPDHDGTIRGRVEGDLLRVQWIKHGNELAAVQSVMGRAWLRVKTGGKTLEGRFGYDESDDDAGTWTAEKSEY